MSGRAASPLYHLQQAIAADPNYAEPHYHLGLYLLGRGDQPAAEEQFAEAVTIAIRQAEMVGAEALALAEEHRFSEARNLLAQTKAQQLLAARSSHKLGLQQISRGDEEAALYSFQLAVVCDKTHADALYQQGCMQQKNGDNNAARELYEGAVLADYAHGKAHIGLAETITAEDEAYLAKNHYLTALDLDAELATAELEARYGE